MVGGDGYKKAHAVVWYEGLLCDYKASGDFDVHVCSRLTHWAIE